MQILIRTSGGKAPKKELSFGHVYRCLNLAERLQSHKIYFLIEDYGGVKEIIKEHGFKNISLLKKGIDVSSDIKKTKKILVQKKIDVLIIDRYKLKQEYVRKVRKYAMTVIISDLRNIEYPSDMVVNGFIGFKNQVKKNSYGAKCFLGPNYQILNPQFAEGELRKGKKNQTLLATFGGFDEKNVVQILLSALTAYIEKIRIKIILGPGTIKSKQIKEFEKKFRKHITIIQKTRNMFKEMSDTEYGICSGGITTYEFAALNVPFAIVSQVEHQLITARAWKKLGVALDLGIVSTNSQKKIENFLEKIIRKKTGTFRHKPVVDGLGAQRIVTEIFRMNSLRNFNRD